MMKYQKAKWENMNLESINLAFSKASRGPQPVVNNRIKRELLTGSKTQKADYLYDWAAFYLNDKNYKKAEVCLLEIEKLDCWNEDETLKPGTYSLFASCYFNMAIKKHFGSNYELYEFEKAKKYAEDACNCILLNEDFEKRTKTGAWQVLFCIAILCKDVMAACKIREEHHLHALTYQRTNPFEPSNDWYVCNEIDEQFFENEFNILLKQTINNSTFS